MEHIFWKGISAEDRHTAISKIQSVVSKYGDLVDFHCFSDISLSMTIEIEEFQIGKLYDSLSQILEIQKPEFLYSNSKKERIIYLNITFSKGTGDLKIEIPSVPG